MTELPLTRAGMRALTWIMSAGGSDVSTSLKIRTGGMKRTWEL